MKRQAERTRSKQKSRKIKCWSCGKVGHFANECDEKKKEDKEKKRTDQAKRKGESNSKVAFLANGIIINENNVWIVDSAASAHMSPNKSIFYSFVKLRESEVIVADNTKLQVKGSGTVNIPLLVNGETRIVVAKEVLYVPNLSVNLLSVRKIAGRGFYREV